MVRKLLLALMLICNLALQAQRSAPVMGDAASLIDLLKKDYSSSNPETKLSDIKNDREKVIGIFKSYLKDTQRESLVATDTLVTALKSSDSIYTAALNSFNGVSKANITINNQYTIDSAASDLAAIQEQLIKKKNDYYRNHSNFDLDQLAKIRNLYSADNSYLKKIIALFEAKYKNLSGNGIDGFSQNNYQSSINKSLPFIGGDLAFETLIDGLSRFLAKRIKEELTVYAIDKIKKYLNDPRPENYSQELQVILPKTTNYLRRFDSSHLLSFNNELKQQIEMDLNSILENAQGLRNLPKIAKYVAGNPDLEFAFDGLNVLSQISKVKNAVDYFEFLEQSKGLENWRTNLSGKPLKYNIAQAVRLATMLSYSLTVADNGEQKFASVDFLSNYGSYSDFYILYFGFLHQQNEKYFNIAFRRNSSDSNLEKIRINRLMELYPYDDIKSGVKSFNFIRDQFSEAAQNAEKIFTAAQSIKKKRKNNEEIKYEEIHGFVNDMIDFSQKIVAVGDTIVKGDYILDIALPTEITKHGFAEKMQPYFDMARSGNDLVLDLHQKKYSNAIIKAVEIPLLLNKNAEDKNGSFSDINSKLTDIKYALESQKDLALISEVFKSEITFGSIEKQKTQLKIISLKMYSWKKAAPPHENELKEVINSLEGLVESDSNNYRNKIAALRTSLKDEEKKVLTFYGIDLEKINKEVGSYLEEIGQPVEVRNYVAEKILGFSDAIYKYKVLNYPDQSISVSKELSAAYRAFAPGFIESRDVLKDGQALKIINFINDISLSSTPEDVEKAIDAFALPVGSSNLKERATSYYAINSFPGILGGFEFTEQQPTAGNIGFTAPVGLYFQPWGAFKKGGSLGVFLPVIDIAAPVRLRLDGSKDTQTLPDFDFSDIFAPGFYLVYGFRNSPLALNLGIQYGPKLRNIPVEGVSFESFDSYRFNFGVTIDIPLLTLSGKYKN